MSHSYVKDLKYLSRITKISVPYIGLSGPRKRREKTLNQLINKDINIEYSFLNTIHGPAGLNIGSGNPSRNCDLHCFRNSFCGKRSKTPIFTFHKR